MRALMMDSQLTILSVMEYAKKIYPETEIVSITHDHDRHRYTFKDAFKRVSQLANALKAKELNIGDRVATLAWNDFRHFELYYATSCSGLVCHTINPRLFPEQIEYIVNHANDRALFVDPMFVPLIEQISNKLVNLEHIIVLTSEDLMPKSDSLNLLCYETLIGRESTEYTYPQLNENDACSLCYTSGTTGEPKGVLYSHRSTILHGLASMTPNAFNISNRETVLPIVPMFHVNAWSLPYTCVIAGAKLVFPGNKMADGKTLANLINEEKVTFSAGVPTVWLALHQYLTETKTSVESLKRCIVGGSACPLSLMDAFRDNHKVDLQHAWGMTELSPLGTMNKIKPQLDGKDCSELDLVRVKQGIPLYGVETKIVDDVDEDLPWDGEAFGKLKVKGPWVASAYYNQDTSTAHDDKGWFDTGDVCTFDKHGYMQIVDRTKDVIKSGGEWISSIELENIAVAHPDVSEAAVIGIAHSRWDERPVVFAVKNEHAINETDLLSFYDGKVAKWSKPDKVVFVDSLPHTASGKLDKKVLRQTFAGLSLE